VKFGRKIVLPIHKGLIGDQRVILVLWNFKIPEKFEVLEGHEALVFVEFADDFIEERVG
jgi:hypothetical protein